MADLILELSDVSLSFKGLKAINALSFSVERGEICALIGPNGAGKSSALNILNGVYRADSGHVAFDGQRLRSIRPGAAARLGIGRTFQHAALFTGLSVLDNVLAGLARYSRTSLIEHALGLPRDAAETRRFREAAEETLSFLELTPYRDRIVATLPYGIQKRVDLARALVARPTLLLLDEPMAGMNGEEKRAIARFIVAARDAFGTTVVLIEHDLGIVMRLSDHVVVLDYGRKVGDGPPDAVRNDPAVIAAYLGKPH
ncbi:ABC transporter ATP-binding protein [Methylobacterium gossipiicola]|uniref:Amino acid/amide ABC transporter ATP-binding protein 1, HAAT family n=1 Tax=Methylobacterium gossipiicola TaxID=582675 RepID=A0A1I2XGM7_9HYPH|nr:ABC transporter ATP-binding protein [Methylobacterium gossipiicola]SFH12572.1 amino acid/amide ABC transporter ATP-binding protein 1, HAAT family [Methylobacterium gossipiicola]